MAKPIRHKKQVSSSSETRPVCYWPSHHQFAGLVDFCVNGREHPFLQTCTVGDHIANTVGIFQDDIDPFLWDRRAEKSGLVARNILQKLEDRIFKNNDKCAAEILYAIATEAAHGVLNLYLRHRTIFNQITPQRKFLPALFSIHPDTAKLSAQIFRDSKLGTQTDHALQAGSRAYFVSDSPPNVYSRAIIESVKFNRELEPVSCQQSGWKEFRSE